MSKKIYAFAGRKRSGKGVLCNLLVKNYNAKIITIANYLKYLCCELINCDYDSLNRMKDDGTVFNKIANKEWIQIINSNTNIDKNIIKKEIGTIVFTNVRQMLQVIGTDLIRKYNPNWHINKMIDEINSYNDNEIICIDDVRFPNEKKAIEDLNGTCFFIIRDKYMDVSNHISEKSLFWHDFKHDKIILNSKDVNYMEDKFIELFNSNFSINNGLMLSMNKNYICPLMNLGITYDYYTKLILDKIIDRYDFNHEGKFSIKLPYDKNFINTYKINENEKGYYVIDNPCAIENFKQWI